MLENDDSGFIMIKIKALVFQQELSVLSTIIF